MLVNHFGLVVVLKCDSSYMFNCNKSQQYITIVSGRECIIFLFKPYNYKSVLTYVTKLILAYSVQPITTLKNINIREMQSEKKMRNFGVSLGK